MRKYTLIFVVCVEIILCGFLITGMYRRLHFGSGNTYKLNIITLHRSWYTLRSDIAPGYYEPIAFYQMEQEATSGMMEPVVYTINGDTLNERFDYPVDKPPHTFRIVTLGDSFAFGMYVNTNENWPEQLEDTMNRENTCDAASRGEVINVAVPGYDIDFETVRYATRGKKYRPDIVIWHLTGNDLIERSSFVFTDNPRVVAEKREQGLTGVALLQAVNKVVQSNLNKRYGGEEVITGYQLGRLKQFLATMTDTRVLILLEDNYGQNGFMPGITNITDQFSNVTVRLLPTIDRLPDTHPSPMGHKQIATYVYMFLRNAGFVHTCIPLDVVASSRI